MQRYVYFAAFQPGFIKIGSSIRPNKRIIEIGMESGGNKPKKARLSTGVLLGAVPGSFERERQIHSRFGHLRISGCREWFIDSLEIRKFIPPSPIPADAVAEQGPKMALLKLPKSLHVRLRNWCDARGRKMQFTVAEMIEKGLATSK